MGTPNGPRFNVTLNESQIACTANCAVVMEWNFKDMPLISSDPNCPLVDFKIMKDDGYGTVTQEVPQTEVMMEVYDGKARIEFDSAAIAKMLQSGKKLNYVLIGVTASGWHKQAG